MSIKIVDRVWASSQAEGGARLVLLAIADCADQDTGTAWPGVKLLAQKARMSQRNVQYHLRRLAAMGELRVEPQAGPHGCNMYTVLVGIPLGVQSTAPMQPAAGGVKSNDRGGATHGIKGVQPTAPEPSLNHQEPSEAHSPKKPPGGNGKASRPEQVALEQRWAEAYASGLSERERKALDWGRAKRDSRRGIKAGIDPGEVVPAMQRMRAGWWAGKPLPLCKVIDDIVAAGSGSASSAGPPIAPRRKGVRHFGGDP